jgi:hypothetical protein
VTTFPRPRRPICRSAALCFAWLATLAPAASVRAASEQELLDIIHGLEQRVEQLETRQQDERTAAENQPVAREGEDTNYETGASWADRVRLSGSANMGWYGGASHAVISQDSFDVWDARFFVDAELGRDVTLGETTLVRDIGLVVRNNADRVDGIVTSQQLGGRLRGRKHELRAREKLGMARSPFVDIDVAGSLATWCWLEFHLFDVAFRR